MITHASPFDAFADRNHAKLYNRLTDCVKQLRGSELLIFGETSAFVVNLPPGKPYGREVQPKTNTAKAQLDR